ncbi:bile acid:sodium symporter family protein [Hyphomicrobium sp.]|uniref:bile acid:sodium symporter family protein n=1 Tax=Hyphomicrobium sp. TaxID=82 RepID=UPI002D783C63|nr:bile acid:sodium symporter family protein [Hyphomicrobium sp.]HET6389548.1 bile acid:sodium symporter family protein [Hyphomicrobium sp.]
MLNRLHALRPDPFTLAIMTVVAIASMLPARGIAAESLGHLVKVVIVVLFFLYGARVPREAVIANLSHWRLHAMITLCTFVMFPLLALLSGALVPHVLSHDLYVGIVFLSVLPSTLQASIVFTSLAGGNVPAAICSASLSSLLGVVLTPALVALLLNGSGASVSLQSIEAITAQVLLPFIAGQLARPWLGRWADRNKAMLISIDRASILLMVYSAFSEAVVGGLWHRFGPADFSIIIAADIILLALVLVATTQLARRAGFSRADEIAIVFCGSKKSMVVGLPMANVLFAGQAVGVIVTPLMVFHQVQLIACAILARRYAARQTSPSSSDATVNPLPAR